MAATDTSEIFVEKRWSLMSSTLPRRLEINVTAEIIAQSEAENCRNHPLLCPISRAALAALQPLFIDQVWVKTVDASTPEDPHNVNIWVYDQNPWEMAGCQPLGVYPIPDFAHLLKRWDRGGQMKSFQMDLKCQPAG